MTFNIKNVTATRTVVYKPDFYLQQCRDDDEQPTSDGFLDWIRSDVIEDFGEGGA